MIEIDLNDASLPLSWQELFGRNAPTDVELGSGKGRFLLEMAGKHPERNFVGVERAAKYHKLLATRTARRGLDNVRALRTTAEDLLFRLLAPASVSTFFVLFPDPWPKKRHHKRRLFTPEITEAILRALVPGGRLLVKTDHPEYGEVIEAVFRESPGFKRLPAERIFEDLPLTGFEVKYVQEGRPISAFALERTAPEVVRAR